VHDADRRTRDTGPKFFGTAAPLTFSACASSLGWQASLENGPQLNSRGLHARLSASSKESSRVEAKANNRNHLASSVLFSVKSFFSHLAYRRACLACGHTDSEPLFTRGVASTPPSGGGEGRILGWNGGQLGEPSRRSQPHLPLKGGLKSVKQSRARKVP
jgi:hypothetical protein